MPPPLRWQQAPLLGGPGGGLFDDVREVEDKSGRSIDEFVLVNIEFFTWASLGAIRTVYASVIDGYTVSCEKKGRIGDTSDDQVLNLRPGEWITSATGVKGESRYQTGGVCVDSLNLSTTAGSFGVRGNAVRPGRLLDITTHLVVREDTESDADERKVVRAVCGRAGDSLDAIGFLLGPRIPTTWSPQTHHLYPRRTRDAIWVAVLASRRPDSLFAKLNADCLLMLYCAIAAWSV